MLFFEALKLGYLIHLHPLDNAHAERTKRKGGNHLRDYLLYTFLVG